MSDKNPNSRIRPYDHVHILRPGEEVSFIPSGVPGPHHYMIGIHASGKSTERSCLRSAVLLKA